MRTESDIVSVSFQISGLVQLDWERVEEDPVWNQVVAGRPLDTPEEREFLLREYLNRYLSNEVLLMNTPSTNGPASLVGNTINIVRKGGASETAKG